MPFIKTSQLTKEYQLGKTTVHALRGVDIEVEKGEYLCVSGPSGAGKSTFLNLIGLLDRPTSGSIHFDDTEVHTLDRKKFHRFRRGRIAFIFQSFNLVPVPDARENIEFPLLIQKIDAAEPTANLDSVTGRTIMELLKRLNREERTTFIIASHDTTLIREADRMIRIVCRRLPLFVVPSARRSGRPLEKRAERSLPLLGLPLPSIPSNRRAPAVR